MQRALRKDSGFSKLCGIEAATQRIDPAEASVFPKQGHLEYRKTIWREGLQRDCALKSDHLIKEVASGGELHVGSSQN